MRQSLGDIALVEGNNELNVALTPITGDLRGRVYDMVTTEPLAGVAVSIADQTAYTDSAGEYGFPSMQVGTYSASFSKAGYVTTYYEALVIKEGDNVKNVGLVPEPTPTGRLSGKVTDSFYGTPVSGVKITLTGYRAVGDPPRTEQVYYETFTDDQGRYSFSDVLTMSYAVSFIKESYESKVVSIDLQFEDKTLDVKLVWTAAGLRLYMSNPQIGISVWDALLIDLSTMKKIPGTPAGIKEPHVPMDFVIPTLTFLLQVMEMPWAPDPGPYWRGPYLVELPGPGTYTWNSRAGTIDGIAAKNLPSTNNRAFVTGVITSIDWFGEAAASGWGISLRINSAENIAGYENVARYYVGQTVTVLDARIPLDSVGQPAIKTGTPIHCFLEMYWKQFAYDWHAWDFYYVGEYPAEAYSFIGGLSSRDYKLNPYDLGYYHDISYSVQAAVPSLVPTFAVVLVQLNVYGGVVSRWAWTGPTSGVLKGVDSWYKPYIQLFAHPNPSARWNQDTWEAERWVRVAALYLHWSDM